jgi:hypothetical protein
MLTRPASRAAPKMRSAGPMIRAARIVGLSAIARSFRTSQRSLSGSSTAVIVAGTASVSQLFLDRQIVANGDPSSHSRGCTLRARSVRW